MWGGRRRRSVNEFYADRRYESRRGSKKSRRFCVRIWCLTHAHAVPVRVHLMSRTKCLCVWTGQFISRASCASACTLNVSHQVSVCVTPGTSSHTHPVQEHVHLMSRTECQCICTRISTCAQESVHVHGNSTRVENGKARERASKNHKPRRLLKPRRRRRQWGCGGGGVGGGDDELSSGTHENLFRKENW